MKSRALTLVEVVISLVILSLTAVGLTSIFVSSGQWIFHSRALMAGAEAGRNFLDPLMLDVSQRDWVDGSNNCLANKCLTGGGGCPGFVDLNNIRYTPATYTTTSILSNPPVYPCGRLRKVVVAIQWPAEQRF